MNSLKFGSASWREFVFATPPVREMDGKARPSQRFSPVIAGTKATVDGTSRTVALYLVEYLQLAGLIKRWKLWPFEWQPEGAGKPRSPFLLLELAPDQRLCVIQTKASARITPKVQMAHEAEAKMAAAAEISHVVWTDQQPLNKAAFKLFYRIRGARNTVHDPKDLDALVDFVQTRGRVTLQEIAQAGHTPTLTFVGMRECRLFLPLHTAPDLDTPVTTVPQTDLRQFLFGTAFDPQAWWKQLASRAPASDTKAA